MHTAHKGKGKNSWWLYNGITILSHTCCIMILNLQNMICITHCITHTTIPKIMISYGKVRYGTIWWLWYGMLKVLYCLWTWSNHIIRFDGNFSPGKATIHTLSNLAIPTYLIIYWYFSEILSLMMQVTWWDNHKDRLLMKTFMMRWILLQTKIFGDFNCDWTYHGCHSIVKHFVTLLSFIDTRPKLSKEWQNINLGFQQNTITIVY